MSSDKEIALAFQVYQRRVESAVKELVTKLRRYPFKGKQLDYLIEKNIEIADLVRSSEEKLTRSLLDSVGEVKTYQFTSGFSDKLRGFGITDPDWNDVREGEGREFSVFSMRFVTLKCRNYRYYGNPTDWKDVFLTFKIPPRGVSPKGRLATYCTRIECDAQELCRSRSYEEELDNILIGYFLDDARDSNGAYLRPWER